MIDENLQILKILSDVAETTFRTRKSSLSRIEAGKFTEEGEKRLKKEIIEPLDDTLSYISNELQFRLNMIPIYTFFLQHQKGVSIYDSAQLITILKDIENFDNFGKLISYAGFYPNARHYNKKLHKLLQRLGYRLINQNPQYQFIFEITIQKYQKEHPKYSQDHIENMAKRIVVKKFLKNLYIHWTSISGDDF